ncbi:beta-1,3-galactosyltransferase 6 [Drosophila ficusphila]|uniref:beta-1,3-galactosyltransferase 6 n=1 Tax=Drosophila ficusphila TaxID=30025 RepID=UPI0007E67937|nr:beta-1,3-galactosyltransferase 6 [Drosophila ficusphila]
MRRFNNLVTLFTAISAFFFGSFIMKILCSVEKCPANKSEAFQLKSHPNLFLLVVVLSAPSNYDQRNVIRKTWLNSTTQPLQLPYYPEDLIYIPPYGPSGHLQLESVPQQANRLRQYLKWQKDLLSKEPTKSQRRIKVKHIFSIGTGKLGSYLQTKLLKEQEQHGDLLLLQEHQDTYSNLTVKLLETLASLRSNYTFSYVLKVDDDTYVKLDSLVNELVSYDRKLLRKSIEYDQNPLPQLYWGYFNGRATIKKRGHWKESNYYLSQNYLPYALGGGYVLSQQLCEYILNSSHLLTPYVSEDVSIGTWVAPLRHVYRWHDPRFDTGYMPRKCQPYHIVLHKRNLKMMTDIYGDKLCSNTGSSSLPEYYYDWTKTSDKCCDSLVV